MSSEINLPHLLGNKMSIYKELQSDFSPSLMKDFTSTIDSNTCEILAGFNLLRYYSERRRIKNLFIEGDYEKSFHQLDRNMGRLPIIGGQIGLGALMGMMKYLMENHLTLPKKKKLLWPTHYHWVERSIIQGNPIIIGLFNHKKI